MLNVSRALMWDRLYSSTFELDVVEAGLDIEGRAHVLHFQPAGLFSLGALRILRSDVAELGQASAHFVRLIEGNRQDDLGRELAIGLLLQVGLGHASLQIGDGGQGRFLGLFDVLGHDVHADRFVDDERRGRENLLFVDGDGQGAERDLVAVIAQLAFHLFDLGPPGAQLTLGGKEVLDFALAGLDDVDEPFFHGPGGPQFAFDVGELLGDIQGADALALQFARLG